MIQRLKEAKKEHLFQLQKELNRIKSKLSS